MQPIFYAYLACAILVPVVVSLLVVRSLRKQERERAVLRSLMPEPDFSAFEDPPCNPDEPEVERWNGLPVFNLCQTPATNFLIDEPLPNFGTKMTVRQAYYRAIRLVDESQAAWSRNHYRTAETFARSALREISHIKDDHWYVPVILNLVAVLRYEQGYTVEARELWDRAEQIALEWPEQCEEVLRCIQSNMRSYLELF